jgi:hypothetical protein
MCECANGYSGLDVGMDVGSFFDFGGEEKVHRGVECGGRCKQTTMRSSVTIFVSVSSIDKNGVGQTRPSLCAIVNRQSSIVIRSRLVPRLCLDHAA